MSFRSRIKDSWTEWTNHIRHYPDIIQCWAYYVKQRIKSLFIREGAERNSDRFKTEDLYYTALYEVLQEPGLHAAKLIKMKAKIIRLKGPFRQRLLIDTSEEDRLAREPPP